MSFENAQQGAAFRVPQTRGLIHATRKDTRSVG